MTCKGDGASIIYWAKYRLRMLLVDSEDPSWASNYDTVFQETFEDRYIKAFLKCGCPQCCETRQQRGPVWDVDELASTVEKMKSFLRIFATCIISDFPLLIYTFLRLDFDDDEFDECISETDLSAKTGVSSEQAKHLLKSKYAFFDGGRVKLFDYLRFTTVSPLPQPEEKKWIQEEMLALFDRLALPKDVCARRMPRNIKVGEITIRDSTYMSAEISEDVGEPLNREEPSAVHSYRDSPVSMTALGYLVVDVIFFLLFGSSGVHWLDRNRLPNNEWLKESLMGDLSTRPRPLLREIDKDTELKRAFELAWVMICPKEHFGFENDGRGNEDYRTVSEHFRRTWQSGLYPPTLPSTDPETERSSEAQEFSIMSATSPPSRDYEEIAANSFRWILLRYGPENQVFKRCWLRVFKTKNNSHIRIDKYRFDKVGKTERIAVKCSSFIARANGLRFVPLYAYGYDREHDRIGFSAKLQFYPSSIEREPVPPIYTFQTIEDVTRFQTEITGRIIEQDIFLNHLELEGSKHWFRKEKELPATTNFGRIQLWQILDDDNLKYVHDSDNMAQKSGKVFPLRLEIALFSRNFLAVVGVKSSPKLEILRNGAIKIESAGSSGAPPLKGFCHQTDWNNRSPFTGLTSTRYPGLQVFQTGPTEVPTDAQKITWKKIELSFQSDEDKAQLCTFLRDRYHAKFTGPL